MRINTPCSSETAGEGYRNSLRAFLEWQFQRYSLAAFDPRRFLDLRVTIVDSESDINADLAFGEMAPVEGRFSIRALALLKMPECRLLLTGISGAGKTVALSCLAHRLTVSAMAALNTGSIPDLIPIWTPAPNLPEVGISSPVAWLASCLQDGGIYTESERHAESILDSGCLVLLIDSLHEVAGISSARTRSLARLVTLPRIRIVTSARPGYELPGAEDRCKVLSLEGLNFAEREQMVLSRELEEGKCAQLHQLVLQPRLRRVVEIPQIWQMAIALAKAGIDLTNVMQEAALYQCFVRETLESRRSDEPSPYLAVNVEPLIEMLGAKSAFKGGQEISFQEAAELVERWASCHGRARQLLYPYDWPQEFLDYLPRFFHPVLRISGKERAIGFAHGSLADFLAARWVLRMWRTVPQQLIPVPQLADLVSFATELLELRGVGSVVVAELDAEQVHLGSLALLLSWLRRTPVERIGALSGGLQERVWRASSDEARQILQALGRRSRSWAAGLMAPVLDVLPEEKAKWFRKYLVDAPRRRSKKLKDMPKVTGPIPSLQELETTLRSDDAGLRAGAARLIGLSGHLEAIDLLIPLLDIFYERSAAVRARVATALGRLGDSRAVLELAARLKPAKEPEPEVRSRIARSLGFLLDNRAVEPLIQCLEDEEEANDFVRGAVINALGILEDLRAIEVLMRRLDREYESDLKNRSAAAKSLGALGDTRAVTPLLRSLDPLLEPSAEARGSAATALGILGDTRAVIPLLLCLDPKQELSAEARGAAATALGGFGDARAVAPLLLRLDPKQEPDAKVRGSAATALGVLGDSYAAAPLLLCLDPKQEPYAKVRASAATALGVLGDSSAVAPLLLRLDPKQEPSAEVRGSAATALGGLGDARAVAPLLLRLDPKQEPDAKVRGSAATALGMLGDSCALTPLLLRLDLKQEPDARVRISAEKALKKLRQKGGDTTRHTYYVEVGESEAELGTLEALWAELLGEFFLWTEIPLEKTFPNELDRCLVALERYLGGAASRRWNERDYERVLAALLAKDRGGVVTQAEPADRERTDILVQLSDGSKVVLELKFYDPHRLTGDVSQLRRYLSSFKDENRSTAGHLILLDQNPNPDWNATQRRSDQDGVSIWRVHVNRQPASQVSRAKR